MISNYGWSVSDWFLLDLKLKYQLTETTTLEPLALIDRTVLQIQNTDCKIITKTDKIVAFKDDGRGFRSKASYFRNIDEGVFEISISDKKAVITFIYCISIVGDLIFAAGFIILGLIMDYRTCLFALPLLLQMVIRIECLKNVGKQMVMEIVRLN